MLIRPSEESGAVDENGEDGDDCDLSFEDQMSMFAGVEPQGDGKSTALVHQAGFIEEEIKFEHLGRREIDIKPEPHDNNLNYLERRDTVIRVQEY